MQQPWYATREQVKRALDSAETARNNAQVDRAITSASRSVEHLCHRRFAPWDGIKYIGFPRQVEDSYWRLFLNGNDLISVSTLVSAGTTISSSDYFLEPADGPPYTELQIDQASNAVFAQDDTWQRSAVITGTWGWWDEQEQVGTLANNLDADITDTATITWSDPADVGVGSILKIDSERIIITDMSYVDSTQNLGGSGLTASAAAVTVAVSDSTGFYVGELIRIDSEVMLVVDLATATTLVVKRAWDGSVLAAHSAAADIYGKVGISVSRAALGSTLAAHTTSDVVYRWIPPELINQLCIAEAISFMQRELHGFGITTGESVTKPATAAIGDLRDQVRAAFGRNARTYAI